MKETILETLGYIINGINLHLRTIELTEEGTEEVIPYRDKIIIHKNTLETFKNKIEEGNIYNDTYLEYMNKSLTSFRSQFIFNDAEMSVLSAPSNKERVYSSIIERKTNILESFKQIMFDYQSIEKLHFYQNNIVFIGANGAGKTTLANDLKKHFGNNCVGISAQRVLNIPTNEGILNINTTRQQLKNIQIKDITNKLGNNLNEEFKILLNNLFSEHTVSLNDFEAKFSNGEKDFVIKTVLKDVIKVWNELIEHRILSTDGMNLTLSADGIEEYTANFMSDGEKVVLYIVGQVLTAPQNGFVIIDEPEIFLNKNILNKLWNKLEILRSDCKFIYLTHDLDFAINREASKYWIKSYTKDNFDFSEIENNEIPEILVMELLGSQKNILFCEGNNSSSHDFKILSILFPDFNIKPVESCTNVINYTKAFNTMNNVTIEAFGLIDSDFHPQARLDILEHDNIYNFKFAEVENLCLNEDLFKDFAQSISSPSNSFDIMKNKVFEELTSKKTEQASKHVKMRIDYHYQESHMDNAKTLAELNTNFTTFHSPIRIEDWYAERVSHIDSIVSSANYNEAIQIFNNKGLIGKANQTLGINDYMVRMIRYLNSNITVQNYLKLYFHEKLQD